MPEHDVIVDTRRNLATVSLGAISMAVVVVLGVLGATGLAPLRLLGFVAVALLALGLTVGALWPISASAFLLTAEWTVGLTAGSVRGELTPYLAAGLYLLVESAVTVLERRGVVEAPSEPLAGRVASVIATAGGVWVVAELVLRVGRLGVSAGALTQVAAVSAAVAIVATLAWLLRTRA